MKEGKSVKLNGQLQQHQNGHLSPFKFAKLLDPEASWDKDQLGDVLHWIRQAMALVCGLLWGAIPLVGGIWFIIHVIIPFRFMWQLAAEFQAKTKRKELMPELDVLASYLRFWNFLVISTGIIYGYYAMILNVDEDDFGGHGALLQEGLFASITLFLLAWILVYSLGHF